MAGSTLVRPQEGITKEIIMNNTDDDYTKKKIVYRDFIDDSIDLARRAETAKTCRLRAAPGREHMPMDMDAHGDSQEPNKTLR
jgi:hypothetical protein